MTTFTKTWFRGSEHLFQKHLQPLTGRSDLLFLEIGTFEGMAEKWMLENILTHPASGIHIIDPFAYLGIGDKTINFNDVEKNFLENMKLHENKFILFKGTSEERLPELLNNRYDVVYIDGSHKARDVMFDATLSWLILKKNGILIFDDYTWGGVNPPHMRPRLAIDAFLGAYVGEYEILEQKNQVWLKKI